MNELMLNHHLALKFMSRKDAEVNFLIFQFDKVSLFTHGKKILQQFCIQLIANENFNLI